MALGSHRIVLLVSESVVDIQLHYIFFKLQFKGNTDKSSLKYNIFSNPIITREFTIQLTDWNNWPALRVQILGQPLSLYNCKYLSF